MLGKGGPFAQNGGELVLGPGLICQFAHRMQNTEDRERLSPVWRIFKPERLIDVEVETLMEKAGVAYP
jgi:hypothetical protein